MMQSSSAPAAFFQTLGLPLLHLEVSGLFSAGLGHQQAPRGVEDRLATIRQPARRQAVSRNQLRRRAGDEERKGDKCVCN